MTCNSCGQGKVAGSAVIPAARQIPIRTYSKSVVPLTVRVRLASGRVTRSANERERYRI